ncbi:MAG: hypothetical protein ABL949_13315 [Fimbriimonadaceae bacterium]
MSETNARLERLLQLLEQLLELKRGRAVLAQEQMQKFRAAMETSIPRDVEDLKSRTFEAQDDRMRELNELAEASQTNMRDRMDELKRVADERHEAEIAFRNRMVEIMETQTSLLQQITERLDANDSR